MFATKQTFLLPAWLNIIVHLKSLNTQDITLICFCTRIAVQLNAKSGVLSDVETYSGKPTMKTSTFTKLAVAALTIAIVLPFVPSAQGQPVSDALASRAKELCITRAGEQGFKLKEVTSIVSVADGGVRAVLSLTRQGANATLTCTLSKEGKVALGDDAGGMSADTLPAPGNGPLAWLLLPLLGLPLLWWWAKGRDRANPAYAQGDYAAYGRASEAVVRTGGDDLNVHSAPGSHHPVIRTLPDGQRVNTTGSYLEGWAELEQGGWVHADSLGALTPSHR